MSQSWTTPTREEADWALERLRAERDDITAALLALDRHPGRLLLDGATLTGVTAERAERVRRAQERLWETFAAYGAVLDRAEELRARRARPSRAHLEELGRLLHGPSVEVTGREVPLAERGLLDPVTSGRRLTLSQAVAEMTAAWDEAVACVAAADDVWTRLLPDLDAADARAAAAEAVLRDLGGPAALPAPAGALAAVRDRLRAARETLAGDPLSLTGATGPDPLGLAGLDGELAAAEAALRPLDLLRRHYPARVDRVRDRLTELAAAERETRAARDRAAARVAGPLPAVPHAADALTRVLDQVAELRARRDWPALSARLSALERDAVAARSALDDAGAAYAAALARRDELRGLLQAYRAMAGGRGRGEDTVLQQAHDRARDMLWHGACDLDRAAEAVARYQHAVTTGAVAAPAADAPDDHHHDVDRRQRAAAEPAGPWGEEPR